MVTELEKQFFDMFGIKPRYYYKCKIQDTLVPEDEFILSYCSQSEVIGFCTDKKYYNSCRVLKTYKEYPPITDRILLELICILHKYSNKSCLLVQPYGEDIEQLKKETITSLIIFYANTLRHQKSIYREVRTLFKEER